MWFWWFLNFHSIWTNPRYLTKTIEKLTVCQSQPLFWAHNKILNLCKYSKSYLYLLKRLEMVFWAVIWKIFELSLFLDQSQVSVSNKIKLPARWSETLVILNSFSPMELWKWFLTVFTLFFLLDRNFFLFFPKSLKTGLSNNAEHSTWNA